MHGNKEVSHQREAQYRNNRRYIRNATILKKVAQYIWKLINDYPAIVVAVVIYIYYLLTSIDYFTHAAQKRTFLDYVLQFDSLIWMWLAAAAWLQVQRYRKRQIEESAQRRAAEREIQLQQVQSALLNDITEVLQDSINNPLTIISLKTQEIRRKFETDSDLMRLLESIEGAMRRIEQTIRDLKSYETQKMIDAAAERLGQLRSPQENLFSKGTNI